jgi:FixJ family two-component response regulator
MSPQPHAGPLATPTVFVIDDDVVVRESTKALLEARHYAVEAFSSGHELLARADGTAADCLLLDIQMPGMSGIEVVRVLRQRGDATPVILVSGAISQATHAQAEMLGVRLLEKPIPLANLVAAIEQALARAG